MNMSASDISKNSYVSVSTIYRIIDKLELSGLQAFKSHIHFDRERYQKELGTTSRKSTSQTEISLLIQLLFT